MEPCKSRTCLCLEKMAAKDEFSTQDTLGPVQAATVYLFWPCVNMETTFWVS